MRPNAAPLLLLLAACAAQNPPDPRAEPRTPAPTPSAEEAAAPAPDAADKLRDAALKSSRAFDHVQSLTDEVGPRLAGSPGDKAAVAWAVATMKALGLKNVRAEKVMVPHWERGEESGQIVAPSPQALALTALGGSVGTPAGGLEAEVVMVESLDALEKLDASAVKGKIVFFSTPTERTKDGSGYGKAGAVRGRGPIAAAKKGAAGVLIRSIGTDHDRMPHTGATRTDPQVPAIPSAALSVPDAEMLERLVRGGKTVRVRMSLGAHTLPDAESANVVGEVPGREKPGEIVLLGAHLDSWDLGRGAVDDGAGCAAVLEAGRQIAALSVKPRRTVRVVLFANEENGLRGAEEYAKAHAAELGKHVLALEMDLGAGKVYGANFMGAPEAAPVFEGIARLLSPLGIEADKGDAHNGADLIPLREAGVPFAELSQDASHYFDVHHTANDTLDQVVKEELDQAAAAVTTLAYAAAEAKDGFGRIPEEKRKRKW
jgi:hypothetical protein